MKEVYITMEKCSYNSAFKMKKECIKLSTRKKRHTNEHEETVVYKNLLDYHTRLLNSIDSRTKHHTLVLCDK